MSVNRTYFDMGRFRDCCGITPMMLGRENASPITASAVESRMADMAARCDRMIMEAVIREAFSWGFRLDPIQPTFEDVFGCAEPDQLRHALMAGERDPDVLAEVTADALAPVAEERPLTRKESYDEFIERSTKLIEEHRRNHE